MDGAAHERDPDRLALDDQLGQLVRLESHQPGPQADVRRVGSLRLKSDQVLDRGRHRHRGAPEQKLAVEQGTVECTGTDPLSHTLPSPAYVRSSRSPTY